MRLGKIVKATGNFVKSVCTSVHLHGTTRIPLDGYS